MKTCLMSAFVPLRDNVRSFERLLSGLLICEYEYPMSMEENWLRNAVSKVVCRRAENLNASINREMCVDIARIS